MFRQIGQRKNRVDAHRSSLNEENKQGKDRERTIVCPKCQTELNFAKLFENLNVCSRCDYHHALHCMDRVYSIFDDFNIINHNTSTNDPISYPGYLEKITELSDHLGVYDAVVCGEGILADIDVMAIVMDTSFMMGSMGTVVGEKITLCIEEACRKSKPLIIFSASGGARMQEGILSLMQMAKTSSAIAKFHKSGGLYISVLTDPTFGGVTASFASLADIVLAEPGARIGFAGPRVIEQTLGEKLPHDFQRSEVLMKKGFVDKIVHRHDLKETLVKILKMHEVT